MKARDIMTRDPRTCRAQDPVEKALAHMDACECGAVPVVDEGGAVIGILTDRDIVFGARKAGGALAAITVESCMSADPFTVGEGDTVEDVIRSMSRHRIRRAPVVNAQGALVGIIAQADIAARVQDDALVAQYLRDISTAPPTEPAPER